MSPDRSFRRGRARGAAVAVGLLAAALAACSDGGGPTPVGPGGPARVALTFAAQVNGEPFACGRTYPGLGTGAIDWEPSDLRFYVSNVRLVREDGTEQPVDLDQDGSTQVEGIALLDFEDATARCSLVGTPATNVHVRGQVPAGDYAGLRFTLGVPFERNHGDASVAPPPLDSSAMFWTWNSGYRFLVLDGTTPAGAGYSVHVGSTRCQGDGRGNVSGCDYPNRAEIALDGFDPARDAVVLDAGVLLSKSDLSTNAPGTSAGCQGSPTDPDCEGPFELLGLSFGGVAAPAQAVFRVGAGQAEPPPPTPVPTATPAPTATPGPGGAFAWNLPAGFPLPIVPADNPMSQVKVELGRRLFYDVRLSRNGTQACASCHRQELAFSDGATTSRGSTGELTPRNSPSLANAVYNPTLTWMNPLLDTFEKQALVPLFGESPVELGFGGREDELAARVAADPVYRSMFDEAFPGEAEPVSVGNLVKALGAFQRTLVSGSSPYDRWVAGEEDALSASAKRGKDLFFSELLECRHCHGGLNFASALQHDGSPREKTPFENNGLYDVGGTGAYPAPNVGLVEFTGDVRDSGRMKPPTLRNIALTAPYMHDGSIATLEGVVEHYARGGRKTDSGPAAGDGALSPYKSTFITGF
ncbi:MAG: MbnH family di-heme enzyme, partial [Alphaproteobacteria bacterium]